MIKPVDHYSFSALVTSFAALALGSWVLIKGTNQKLKKLFFWYTFVIAYWSFFVFLCTTASERKWAYLFCQLCHVGGVFIPIVFLNFVQHYTTNESKFLRKIVFFGYCVVSFVSLVIIISPRYFISRVEPKFTFNYFPTAGPIFIFWNVIFVFFVLVSALVLLLEANKRQEMEKKQLQFFLVGNLIGYSGGLGCFFPVYGVSLFPFPFGIWGVFFFTCVTAYAVLKYKFLDLGVFFRKTVVFAGLLAFVFGVFSAATFLVQEVLSRLGAGKVWTYGISLFLIVLGYDHIRNLLVNLTDKYFFQKKYNYQELLKDASRGMSKIESLHRLLGLVVHFITMRMRVKNAAIMMRRRDNEYELGFQRGYDKNFLEYRLDDTNPMIMYLKREKEAIDIEHVREFMESGNKKSVKGEKPHEYDFQAILLTMQELTAACVVPSFLGHELQNVLLIGEKKSGDYYTTEDLNVLFTLAQESAIAIENAKLFDEALKKSSQLEKINEQLEYSRNLLMKALSETEVANKQLQDTQAQLIHEQKMATLGRLAASVGHEVNNPLTILSMNVSRAILKYRKNPDLRVGEVLDLFQKMEQNIGRIKAVVNTLTGLLKRSEKGKFEPLSLKLILEETLPLVQFQTYLDNLTGTEVDFDISGSVPLIRGDLERLQEVFLNLFINAYHAMMGKRARRIRVTAEMDTENQHNVAVHFTDNGCGMTEEVMRKIFNYGFTTKPPGRGSGMGLYMCKYIIELHGGDIRVRSKVGEGTTFTITLPAYEEGMGESGGAMRIEATS